MHYKKLESFSAVARDHALNPRNQGPLKKFDAHSKVKGPCGDTMEFWFQARDNRVELITFITDGCRSSIACGSMAATWAVGRPVEAAAKIRQKDILDALGGLPPEFEHCALLAANTVQAACEEFLKVMASVK